jgi:SAM-dependent methyltransferase
MSPTAPPFAWRQPGYNLLSGRGIEIGAFEHPATLPPACRVEYVDAITPEEAQRLFPEISTAGFKGVDHLIDLNVEGLAPFPDGQFDFVIINHVLEHTYNPIRVLDEVFRVTRPGGHVVLAIPDRDFTFDRPRPLTPFAHLRDDYERGVTTASPEDYMDIPRYIFPQFLDDPQVLAQHLAGCMARREHIHVWTSESFRDFLSQSFALLSRSPTLVYEVTSVESQFEYFGIFRAGAKPRGGLLGRLARVFGGRH